MAITRRAMELVAAAAMTAFGGAIIAGSLQLSTGWAATGPQSGYFPFRLGILLCITSLALLVQAAWAHDDQCFATGAQWARSLSVFAPTLLLVVLMPWMGCYVSSGVYLLYMARRHGGFRWRNAVALSLVLVVALYGLFDYWFMVPLAKGPVEDWLGLS